MMKKHLIALLLVQAGWSAAPAFAWSQLGHGLIGDLAQSRLTPAARAQVDSLLAGEHVPTLGGVASWADELRNTDPARFQDTSAWHYIDSKDHSCVLVLKRDCPDGNCVVAAIEA